MVKPKTHNRVLISLPIPVLEKLKWQRKEFGVPVSTQISLSLEDSWSRSFIKKSRGKLK